jgi:transposase
MRSVALDLGARKIAYCEITADDKAVRRMESNMESLVDLLGPKSTPAVVAIEACREAWHVHDILVGWGHEVLLVDTTRVGKLGIGQHGRKTDRIDAEVLARAVKSGHIPRAHVLSPARRELRMQLGVRRTLVEARTNAVVTVRGLLRAQGKKLRSCDPECFLDHYRKGKFDEETKLLCVPLIALLETIEAQLATAEQRLQALASLEPMLEFLMTAPGVGLVVAAAFVSVVDDAKRFRKAHQLESYLGLVPGEDSSGGKRRIGAITKQGNTYLRSLLVQGAWAILHMKDGNDPLHAWGTALAERRGKKVAAVALARRLAGVLWAMWRDGTVYDADVVGQASATGMRREAQSTNFRAARIAKATAKAKIFGRLQRRVTQATKEAAA